MSTSTPSHDIETRALAQGKWANLVMALAGVTAAYLSHSDALLVDGMYSAVNFASAIIAARIAATVQLPADRDFPFGYDLHEPLYVTFRALVLIGVLAFALFGAGAKILTYVSGGEVPVLKMGPILAYTMAMIVICLALAWRFHQAWLQSGRSSDLLRTESRAAITDGVLSAGAGGALLLVPLLQGTRLGAIVPVADAIVVLVLGAVILPQPLAILRGAMREVAGGTAEPEQRAALRGQIDAALDGEPFEVLDLAVTKAGRNHFVVAYLRPQRPTDGETLDALRGRLRSALGASGAGIRFELVVTATAPFGGMELNAA